MSTLVRFLIIALIALALILNFNRPPQEGVPTPQDATATT